ncbi:MerR family transcriptional regulator [Paenibacillus elgii]|uniref:MerR family transcriptional regulator n=1 Tax=Paenibacillus elgii TaxID=189691 RepID=UPI000248C1D4|nr:GyrI-like domain-containing protein [Paenibacillus elgii]
MLTVGQLARIFNVSAKTLRHYDAVGLFTPVKIGEENQYRFYSPGQLPELRRILFLRSMGLSIEIIRELKRNGTLGDGEKLKPILLEHADSIRDEIGRQQKLLAAVQHMVDYISITGGTNMEPKLVKKAAFTVVGMEWNNKSSEGGIPQLWDRFVPREDEIQGKLQPDVSYGVCIPGSNGDLSYIAGFETTGEHLPNGMIKFTVPEQTYAVFTHTGSLRRLGETMELIYRKWLPLHSLEPSQGMDLEVYDERFTEPEDERTQIDLYIPVKH